MRNITDGHGRLRSKAMLQLPPRTKMWAYFNEIRRPMCFGNIRKKARLRHAKPGSGMAPRGGLV